MDKRTVRNNGDLMIVLHETETQCDVRLNISS